MDQNDLTSYKKLYLDTARENLHTITENLASLNVNPQNTTALEAVFTGAHSLKGKSRMMGYQTTGRLAHLIEIMFRAYRQKGSTMPEIARATQDAAAALTENITSIESTDKEVDMTGVITTLQGISGMTVTE